jgi:hypothetical protein
MPRGLQPNGLHPSDFEGNPKKLDKMASPVALLMTGDETTGG